MSGSLQELPFFVTEAFLLEPVVPFVPENVVFGRYTFVPWVRTGIAQAVTDPAPGASRARVVVGVKVEGDGHTEDVTQTLVVRGPGDVVDISGREIVRRFPVPDATRAENIFLAHIEFDRPDFPWIFSPAAPAGGRLRPWITLVVLRRSRAELRPASEGLPPRVRTTLSELQPLDDAWAWAHAQVVGPKDPDATTSTVADRLTSAYGAQNLSRLLCPRRLSPGEEYLACVVPTYHAGVTAGLGTNDEPTLDPAWSRAASGSDANNEIVLPVYDSWQFATGPEGDFESLAEKLVAVPAPWQVGRRVVDVSHPDGGLPDLAADAEGRLQTVRGPLVSPQAPDPSSRDPEELAAAHAEHATWPAAQTELLRALLNAPDELSGGKSGVTAPDEIPLVGPEIYGRYHAAANRVEPVRDPDWFGQLNLLPTQRVTAGLGTRVVQRDQEALMQSAWAQVGRIDEANELLRRAQLARFVGKSLHNRHLSRLGHGPLLQATRAIHSRVRAGPTITLHAGIDDSALASASTTAVFRRVTRPQGPLTRFVGGPARAALNGILGADGAARDFRRPYADLDGVTHVSEASARAIDPALIVSALGLDNDDRETAVQALIEHGAALSKTPGLPDLVTPESVEHAVPDLSVDLQERAGARLLKVIKSGVEGDLEGNSVRVALNVSLLRALQQTLPNSPVGHRAHDLADDLLSDRVVTIVPLDRNLDPLGDVHLRSLEQPILQPETPGLELGPEHVVGPRFDAPFIGAVEVAPDRRLVEALQTRVEIIDAVTSMEPISKQIVTNSWPGTPVRTTLDVRTEGVLASIDPPVTVTRRILARLGSLPDWIPADWFDDGLVQPIMAAPVFTRPMYEALNAYDREWLIPGLATFDEPDLVTVLLTNARFIESFLVGLSHEMGRELLWRGYPTDQRGTYFRRFWNGDNDELVQDIHRFSRTALGTHLVATLSGRLVLLVRGELLRRYPSAMVLALRAGSRDSTGHPIFIDPASNPTPPAMAPIVFEGHLSPNISLVGFDLTVQNVRDHDWWFVIAEHPTAPRFGADEDRELPLTRDTIAWPDLPSVFGAALPLFLTASSNLAIPDSTLGAGVASWGSEAATMAHILLHDPVRAAWEAKKLLGPTGAMTATAGRRHAQ